jgi:hypothetical protein
MGRRDARQTRWSCDDGGVNEESATKRVALYGSISGNFNYSLN